MSSTKEKPMTFAFKIMEMGLKGQKAKSYVLVPRWVFWSGEAAIGVVAAINIMYGIGVI